MIFFDFYIRNFSIPKVLSPVADCMKNLQQTLVADQEAFAQIVEKLKEKFNAIPNAQEKFLFKVSDGSIAVYINETKQSVLRIYFIPVCGMYGFDNSQVNTHPVPYDGDGYYTLPDDLKNSVQKGDAK